MHSPTPWSSVCTPACDLGNIRYIGSANGTPIADIRHEKGITQKEALANAYLMAAAPDLLAALEDCITNERATCIVQNDVAYMLRRFKAINAICREAIAKARNLPALESPQT